MMNDTIQLGSVPEENQYSRKWEEKNIAKIRVSTLFLASGSRHLRSEKEKSESGRKIVLFQPERNPHAGRHAYTHTSKRWMDGSFNLNFFTS